MWLIPDKNKFPKDEEFPILIRVETNKGFDLYLIMHLDEDGDMVDEHGDVFSAWTWDDVSLYMPIPKPPLRAYHITTYPIFAKSVTVAATNAEDAIFQANVKVSAWCREIAEASEMRFEEEFRNPCEFTYEDITYTATHDGNCIEEVQDE